MLEKSSCEGHPVIPLVGAAAAKLSGTTLRSNLIDVDVQERSLRMVVDRLQPDGVFPFMDLTVEIETLGIPVEMPEDQSSYVTEHPIKDDEDVAELARRQPRTTGRTALFTEVVKRMAENYPKLVIGAYAIGPLSMAGELMGVNDLMLNTMLKPDLVKRLLEFTVEVIHQYIQDLFNAGADVVMVLEPTATLLSPSAYSEHALPSFRHLVELTGSRPLILHVCGNTNHLLEAMVDSGAQGLSLDGPVDIGRALKTTPQDIALMGNLDPVRVFLESDKTRVQKATRELVQQVASRERFILSSGCELPLQTPWDNIDAFVSAARDA